MTIDEIHNYVTDLNLQEGQPILVDVRKNTHERPCYMVVVMHRHLAKMVREGVIEQYTYHIIKIDDDTLKYRDITWLDEKITAAVVDLSRQYHEVMNAQMAKQTS